MRHLCALLIAVLGLGAGLARGEELDSASSEALSRTTQLLRDPTARAQEMNRAETTRVLEGQVRSLGGAQQEAVYGLSADLFAEMVQRHQGDPAGMVQELERAQRDPAAFLEKLSPEARARLKAIADQSPANASGAPGVAPSFTVRPAR
jgi:hypothetical protein